MFTLNESDWEEKRYTFPKLRYYNMFKASFSTEDYVTCNLPKWNRSLLAQFRAGILPLEVEIGRYQNTDLADRICKLCNSGEVEDEVHLLCICPQYIQFRNDLFSAAEDVEPGFISMDVFDKLVFITTNLHNDLAEFLKQAIIKRRQILYPQLYPYYIYC